ncbi:MAG: hypothetical protein PUC59_09200 [Firmicutes bacterium]|nr:hypothetical protein [Bacillota bacterium]
MLQFNKNFEKGDVVLANYDEAASFRPDIPGRSEWGFIWERLDETMGQPKCPPIREYEDLKTYAFPDPMAEGRMAIVSPGRCASAARWIIRLRRSRGAMRKLIPMYGA